jgi:hypothetical protein
MSPCRCLLYVSQALKRVHARYGSTASVPQRIGMKSSCQNKALPPSSNIQSIAIDENAHSKDVATRKPITPTLTLTECTASCLCRNHIMIACVYMYMYIYIYIYVYVHGPLSHLILVVSID